ncbi:T9SS type A sorting domain-containing protein, partial [Altibacter sp.]|uniref:T9SS type A sorting domain-containing protein n=1 Tax=Altibacter sp. TaxID=2024823 RepID=UPI0025907FDC
MNTTYRIFLFALLTTSSVLFAQSHTWTGNGGNEDWFNTANWDVGSVPDTGSDVFIPDGFNTEIAANAATANTIFLEGTANLVLANDLLITDRMEISLLSVFIFQSGVISGTGSSIENHGLLLLESTNTRTFNGITIHNFGELRVTNTNQTEVINGTVINNNTNGRIDIFGSGGFLPLGSWAVINNDGLLRKRANGSTPENFYLITAITNNGIIDVEANQTLLLLDGSSNFTNSESGILRGFGVIDITTNFINNGTIVPGNATTAGILGVINNFDCPPHATIEFDLFGTATADYDAVSITGSPHIEGTLAVNLHYMPEIGDEYTVLTSTNTMTCDLPNFISATFNGSLYRFVIFCNSNNVTLRMVESTLNVSEIASERVTFSTYPNPATSQLTVAIPKIYIDSTSEASITIFNNLGQIIDRLQITSETTIINTAAYNRGLYFL